MQELIIDIRKDIYDKVLEFLQDENNDDKILLIRASQGTGKSVTTGKALLENEKTFIWLLPTHINVDNLFKDKVLLPYHVFHLKGRGAKVSPDSKEIMCENPLLDKVVDHNIDVNEFLCKKCENNEECQYREQFRILEDTEESWAGVYQFITTKFLNEYPCDCIVFDETPLSGLQNRITFNASDLDDLYNINKKIYDKLLDDVIEQHKQPKSEEKEYIPLDYYGDCYVSINQIINTLKYLLENLPEKGVLAGKLLIDAFKNKLGRNFELFEDNLNNTNFNGLFYHYKNELYSMLESESGLDVDFKNIFYDVIRIAKDLVKYKDVDEDINFSTLLRRSEKYGSFVTYYGVTKELPDKPIIILDATGDKEVYQNIFGREVIEFNPSLNIKHNIIQITDGMYPKASLWNPGTRLLLYGKVMALIQHWIDSGECRKVYIFTHKPFSTVKSEKKPYFGMSIEKFFRDNNFPSSFYKISHYGAVKGLNLTELMSNGKLILIGTPEPNIVEYLEDVRAWYVGDPLIKNDRYKEPKGTEFFGHDYRYYDKRYTAHMRMSREHQLEHAIERVRFIVPDQKKLVILWSMLPISFETAKMTSREFIEKFLPEYVVKKSRPLLSILSFIKKKEPSKTEFYKRAENRKFTNSIGGVKRLQDKLIEWNLVETYIESGKTFLKLTREGEEMLNK